MPVLKKPGIGAYPTVGAPIEMRMEKYRNSIVSVLEKPRIGAYPVLGATIEMRM